MRELIIVACILIIFEIIVRTIEFGIRKCGKNKQAKVNKLSKKDEHRANLKKFNLVKTCNWCPEQ